MPELARARRRRDVERWIANVRLVGVVVAALEIGVFTESYPPGYRAAAWAITGVFAVGGLILLRLSRLEDGRALRRVGLAAVVFDTLVVSAYGLLFTFEYGNQTRFALVFPVVEASLRYGLLGGIVLPLLLTGPLALMEWWRVDRFGDRPGAPAFLVDRVSFPALLYLLVGLIVGWLVRMLVGAAEDGEQRAREAESLRDQLGRRADLSEAASRCARALGSSLDMDAAFTAFMRELRGLVPFVRMAIVLVDGPEAHVIATAGESAETVMPPGERLPLDDNVLAQILRDGQTVYREDMSEPRFAEEAALLGLGVRSRVAAPLLAGARPIGIISVGRAEPHAFEPAEIELMSLLGRLAATAVQNIRAYEAERGTVDELRTLTELRADFVSLVSHELRSPMAAVIGSARTLQQRWRDLSEDQRDSFLALIADETDRLAALVGDVLDTSRMEAGTFSYRFSDVDIASLVEEAVATAAVGHAGTPIEARIADGLPAVRADASRIRQVLANLIDNAAKYAPEGEPIEVRATAVNGRVLIDVTDRGTGITLENQRLIFEKFGRASGGASKPGTGLGLYIARSIAEAHGGTLAVSSAPGRGATFTLALPAERE